MARKRIGVIECGGTVASSHLKRSDAKRLVETSKAYWLVADCTIVLLRAGERAPRKFAIGPSCYIPSILPPAEVNGCIFEDPQTRNGKTFWLLAARKLSEASL